MNEKTSPATTRVQVLLLLCECIMLVVDHLVLLCSPRKVINDDYDYYETSMGRLK